MAEIAVLADAYKWNVSKLAEGFGLHRDTVRKRLNDAGIAPCGKRGNAPIYDLRDVGPALFGAQQVMVEGEIDPAKLAPKERLDWFRSESERLKFQQTTKTLIPDTEYRDDLAKTLKLVCAFFDSLPDKMERKRVFTREQLEELEKVADELRNQLHTELKEVAD
ncbi:MAG: DUF1441 family protein [Aeromonas veronii]